MLMLCNKVCTILSTIRRDTRSCLALDFIGPIVIDLYLNEVDILIDHICTSTSACGKLCRFKFGQVRKVPVLGSDLSYGH